MKLTLFLVYLAEKGHMELSRLLPVDLDRPALAHTFVFVIRTFLPVEGHSHMVLRLVQDVFDFQIMETRFALASSGQHGSGAGLFIFLRVSYLEVEAIDHELPVTFIQLLFLVVNRRLELLSIY